MIGWIKIYRKITEHWIWSKPEYLQWWIDILLQANFEPKKVLIKGVLLECNRGECLYSYETWSKRWNVTKSKAMRFLKMLEKDSMIRLKNETVTTRLTICNYESYQDERNESETQTKRTRNADETHAKPTKESKEVKNDKNILEGEKISKEEIHKRLFRELKESTSWMEQFCMNQKCTIQEAEKHLIKFYQETVLKGEFKEELKELKNHFINWTKKGNPIEKVNAIVSTPSTTHLKNPL